MGRALIDAAAGRTDVKITAAVDRQGAGGLGAQVSDGVLASADLASGLAAADVYIDFTTPGGTRAAADAALALSRPAVIGTTGLSGDDEAAVARLAAVAPIVVAANFSLGVNLLLGLVQQAARALGPDWDAEIVETHHRAKRDAPSGTALLLRDVMAASYSRAIDMSSTRAGAIPGIHTVGFDGPSDTIELTHTARDRRGFGAGALLAARWIVGRRGWFTMTDVLGS